MKIRKPRKIKPQKHHLEAIREDSGEWNTLRLVDKEGYNRKIKKYEWDLFSIIEDFQLGGLDFDATHFEKKFKPRIENEEMIKFDLSGVDLTGVNLNGVCLKQCDIFDAKFDECNIMESDFREARMGRATFKSSTISNTDFSSSTLRRSDFRRSIISDCNFRSACLSGASFEFVVTKGSTFECCDFRGGTFSESIFIDCNMLSSRYQQSRLSGSKFRSCVMDGSKFMKTDLTNAGFTNVSLSNSQIKDCFVYGLSAWDVTLENVVQENLYATKDSRSIIAPNLEMAQFIYMLMKDNKLRSMIETISNHGVLILGRFSHRKHLLYAIKEKLVDLGFLPIIFDFERPTNRDFTETILTLAGLSRFIVADITAPKSTPLESQAIVPNFMIPFIPLIEEGGQPFSMFKDLWVKHRDWVEAPLEYNSIDQLIKVFQVAVVDPANIRREKLRLQKAEELVGRRASNYEDDL